jgi:hypothetical protein
MVAAAAVYENGAVVLIENNWIFRVSVHCGPVANLRGKSTFQA